MKRYSKIVPEDIGPETRLFFKRYNDHVKSGQPLEKNMKDRIRKTQWQEDKFRQLVKLIAKQTNIPTEIVQSGVLIICENENLQLTDPLTCCWLN